MHRGLDRIGLGHVGWRLFMEWFGQWIPDAVVFVLGVIVITYVLPIRGSAYWAASFIIGIEMVRMLQNFLMPWIHKPKDLTLTEAELLLGVDMPQDEEPSF